MKESAQAALSFLRSNSKEFGLNLNFQKGKEIHIHLPEGAIPKDGPSAGITLTMALYSAFKKEAPKKDVAMTGEITLLGEVLPIGGLNEKLLAAKKGGIKTVLIPQDNEKDLAEIKPEVTEGMKIVPVSTIKQAFPYVFNKIGKSRARK
jgi:ATP-dependent Lon protease